MKVVMMSRIFVVVCFPVIVGLWLLGWVLYYFGDRKK